MKPILWIPMAMVASYIVILLVFSSRSIDADPLTVSQYIAEIPKTHGARRVSIHSHEGDVELGGDAEKQIRRLFKLDYREAPIHIMEYMFETSGGGFTISIHEVDDQVTDILVGGDDLDSDIVTAISQELRDLVPNCRFRNFR